MSATCTGWVLEHSPVVGAARLVLLVLADRADHEGRNAYPSVKSIAKHAKCSESTVHRVLREMEADGHIVREGVSHLRTTTYRIAMHIADPPTVGGSDGRTLPLPASDPATAGPSDADAADPPTVGPKPSIEPSITEGEDARAGERKPDRADHREQFPDELPAELRPHAEVVLRILRQVAVEHAAGVVYPLAVGRVIVAFPRKPLVAQAHALAAWAVDPPRPIKDVVATYRTFLNRERDLASPEVLDGAGRPISPPPRPQGGGPRSPRRESASDLLRALDDDGGHDDQERAA